MKEKGSLVDERLSEKEILGNVLAEMNETTVLIDHFLAHETRHAHAAVHPQTVDEQIVARLPTTEKDLLEYARSTESIATVRHLMHETNLIAHAADHIVERIFGRLKLSKIFHIRK